MNLKGSLLLALIVTQIYASQGDLKNKGDQFRKRMNQLANTQCDNIPRYRTDVLKHLRIKVINAQNDKNVETTVRDMAINALSVNMQVELRKYFSQSTLINDEKGRRIQAEHYFEAVYQQFQQREADQRRVQAANKESRKKLAEIVHDAHRLNEHLRLQRFYARERQENECTPLIECCISVEIDE